MRLCGNGLTKPANTVIMDHTTSYKLNQNRLSWTVEIFRDGIYFIVWVEENHVNVSYVHIGRNLIYNADEYGADELGYSTQNLLNVPTGLDIPNSVYVQSMFENTTLGYPRPAP